MFAQHDVILQIECFISEMPLV